MTDVHATIKEKFYGTGKTAENMFDRYVELTVDAAASGINGAEIIERHELEQILRNFLRGWVLS